MQRSVLERFVLTMKEILRQSASVSLGRGSYGSEEASVVTPPTTTSPLATRGCSRPMPQLDAYISAQPLEMCRKTTVCETFHRGAT